MATNTLDIERRAMNTLDIQRRAINSLNIPGILKITLLVGLDRLKCGKSECRGFMNDDALEVKLQTENCLKDVTSKEVMLVDKLPWHELFVGDLSSKEKAIIVEFWTEMKKVAPLNGRSVVLIKAKCGCPYAKIEAWSSEYSRRRHAIASVKERIKSGEEAICYICKEKHKNISEIKKLSCSHLFHKECIDKLLKIEDVCPLCDEWDESWDESWIEGWNDIQDDFVIV
ncbi:hypothetical protein POM88_015880 [Heracleum sosnowskyi]|uniref:RING-type domain-containing protein n=1 Tax=Heracleum sosnowskyi TaxID=360622 RepID=A0AAD8INP6_9APIA|nr:hypothetical protein POM88_015880 [Heracleum sosnowskyi]